MPTRTCASRRTTRARCLDSPCRRCQLRPISASTSRIWNSPSCPDLRLDGLTLREAHQLTGEIDVFTRAHRHHESRLTVLGNIGVPHGAVEVDTLAGFQGPRGVELQVDLYGPLEHIHELLTGVLQRLFEVLNTLRADAGENRHHALFAQVRAQVFIVIRRR